MSRAKLVLITLASTVTGSSSAYSQQNVFEKPVQSSSDIEFTPSVHLTAVVSAVQETPNGQPPVASPETNPADRSPIGRGREDSETDATKVAPPTVADPPISLSNLKVADIRVANIGTGNIPDDETVDRLPDPINLPMGAERGLYLYYTKPWVNPGFCHQPLYFEDAMLERHGHSRFPYLQPFISGAKFFGTIPLAPYKWTLQGPLEERSTLGSFRPGTPAPILRQRLPYDSTAIRNQLGATAAAAVAIP